MNELLLILAMLALLIVPQVFLPRIPQPLRTHLRLVSALLLLVLVWGFAEDGKLIYKLGLTALAVISLVQTGITYRKLYTGSGQKD